jgi:hypothetical protein
MPLKKIGRCNKKIGRCNENVGDGMKTLEDAT